MSFVHGIKVVTKRIQGEGHGKNATENTGKRQKLRSNREAKTCKEDTVGSAEGET